MLHRRHIVPGPEAPISRPALAKSPPAFQWFRLLFALFGVPFFVVGLVPIAIGVLGFFPSHAEIGVTASELISIEQLGPIRLRRRRPISQVNKLAHWSGL